MFNKKIYISLVMILAVGLVIGLSATDSFGQGLTETLVRP